MRRIALALVLATLPTLVPVHGHAGGYVGYLGCSQARDAVAGYHAVGGRRIWPSIAAFGAGTIHAWADAIGRNDIRWNTFQSYLESLPPSQIWVQWCSRDIENHAQDLTKALAIVKEIKRRAPGIPIYHSAQNGYVAPHVCSGTGPHGPARMEVLSLIMVGTLRGKRGPDVGDLRSRHQIPSIPAGDQTVSDGCHPNTAGMRDVLGPALLRFFG